jgi:hypothetical protein
MLSNLVKKLSNLPGWKTKRKILVIESDDWGSIRMPTNKVYDKLKANGFNLGNREEERYCKYDTLASSEDLYALYEVLESVRDKNAQSVKFTAMSLTTNPDFNKIRECEFQEYHYELFTDTLKRYNQVDAYKAWQEGIKKGIFLPEFHGREHLNIQLWLRALQQNDKETCIAFYNEMWSFKRSNNKMGYQAAFDLEYFSDLEQQKLIIEDGLRLFKQIHGYAASFFVPPNGPINNSLEEIAAANGIRYMSSPKIQNEVFGNNKTKKHFRYLGMKNKHEQIYITRNVFFEPSASGISQVNSCLNEIELAFKYRKPAIISSHRVNFIGGLDETNRTKNLSYLKQLLTQVKKKWPDVEFMTSTELGNLIIGERNA